jgi:hypothetical protein
MPLMHCPFEEEEAEEVQREGVREGLWLCSCPFIAGVHRL